MRARDKLSANTRMASALLDVLGSTGEIAARARALRTAGGEGGALRIPGGWIEPETLCEMFRSVPVDRSRALRVGQALVSPSGLGLALCYSGVATVEKAFRRADQLLARESAGGVYEPHDMQSGSVRVRYRAEAGAPSHESFCAVREGMLSALPLAFGLLPGKAKEVECAHSGAEHCVYEVAWSRQARTGVVVGAIAGCVAGAAAVLAASLMLDVAWPLPPWIAALASAVFTGALGGAIGRNVDLGRQLEAVAGARRGQLALLDQADRSLAERMDELAKIDGGVESAQAGPTGAAAGAVRAAAPRESEDIELPERVTVVAGRIRVALGDLQQRLSELEGRIDDGDAAPDAQVSELLRACGVEAHRIDVAHAELLGGDGGRSRRLHDIVSGAVEAARPDLVDDQQLELHADEDAPNVPCRSFQIEQVVVQLLRNAMEATRETGGTIRVSLLPAAGGTEILVEDDGVGMEEGDLDEVFDPFLAAPVAGVDTHGIGLPICYRIVSEHGGELHVSTEEGGGTRVSALLPSTGPPPAED